MTRPLDGTAGRDTIRNELERGIHHAMSGVNLLRIVAGAEQSDSTVTLEGADLEWLAEKITGDLARAAEAAEAFDRATMSPPTAAQKRHGERALAGLIRRQVEDARAGLAEAEGHEARRRHDAGAAA